MLTNGVTITYNYDDNGNLISKTNGVNTTTYGWDWRNMLTSVSSVGSVASYEYDGAGNRISKTVNGVKTKYINDVGMGLTQVLMETDNAGTVQATYNYGNDLISMHRANANSYYHYDGLGTVKQMTNSSGAIVASYVYDAFGNSVSSVSSVANTYGFTGEQQFAEADNLVYLRARYYQPSYGRFMKNDPIGYYDSMNPYQYCRNNPVNFVDPSGKLIGEIFFDIIWEIINPWLGDAGDHDSEDSRLYPPPYILPPPFTIPDPSEGGFKCPSAGKSGSPGPSMRAGSGRPSGPEDPGASPTPGPNPPNPIDPLLLW